MWRPGDRQGAMSGVVAYCSAHPLLPPSPYCVLCMQLTDRAAEGLDKQMERIAMHIEVNHYRTRFEYTCTLMMSPAVCLIVLADESSADRKSASFLMSVGF